MGRLRSIAGRTLRAAGLRRPRPSPPPASSTPRPRPCDAPARNLYFSATGAVGPCWIQLGHLDERWSPERSILDIGRGPAFQGLRDALEAGEHPGACGRCAADVAQGVDPLARVYDGELDPDGMPATLELELSNVCNLECVMCQGDLSSKIRRNREHRPPLISPYDDSFVEQVAELAPHLQQVRFSGGEPMLHPIVHRIAARLAESRPDLRLMVSTNGTVVNDKVRRLLATTPIDINVSFDSLRADRYEAIRIGGDHARLMANLELFRANAQERGGLVTINTNPMRANWDEMADFVRWCDARGFWLSYNTVLHPEELSLRTLPAGELDHVHRTLAGQVLAPPPSGHEEVGAHNRRAYDDLLRQIEGWVEEARARETPVALSARREPASAGAGLEPPA